MLKFVYCLVIYDINSDKKRNKLISLLKRYGYRIQKSAFKIYINNKNLEDLKQKFSTICTDSDSISIYILNNQIKIYSYGRINKNSLYNNTIVI